VQLYACSCFDITVGSSTINHSCFQHASAALLLVPACRGIRGHPTPMPLQYRAHTSARGRFAPPPPLCPSFAPRVRCGLAHSAVGLSLGCKRAELTLPLLSNRQRGGVGACAGGRRMDSYALWPFVIPLCGCASFPLPLSSLLLVPLGTGDHAGLEQLQHKGRPVGGVRAVRLLTCPSLCSSLFQPLLLLKLLLVPLPCHHERGQLPGAGV
jgi:hypothetical protein